MSPDYSRVMKATQIREIKNDKGWEEQIWYWRTH